MKIAVLDAATLGSDLDFSFLEKLGEVKIYQTTEPSEISSRCSGNDVIILNKIKINENTLNIPCSVKLICIAATGFDNVDTHFCKQNNIAVANVCGYSTNSVAQITAAMVLSLASHLPEYNSYVESGKYSFGGVANCLEPTYHEISGKTWGIVGYGNIGSAVAKIAESLGCRVIVCRKTSGGEFENVDIDTLCRISDIISVHTPLSCETKNLINETRIKSMKNDAIFVNVARGAVADETALANAISRGELGALGVDVYTNEPFKNDHPFYKIMNLPNVCFTPHMAWGSYEARVRCLDEIIKNICAFYEGKTRNRVD